MNPFIVVHDGAYGISFDIVMADTPEEAYKLSSGQVGSEVQVALSVIDVRDYALYEKGIVYTEQPTGG